MPSARRLHAGEQCMSAVEARVRAHQLQQPAAVQQSSTTDSAIWTATNILRAFQGRTAKPGSDCRSASAGSATEPRSAGTTEDSSSAATAAPAA